MGTERELNPVLREIDPGNKRDAANLASLHLELLDWGPIANLGRLILEKFCYSTLIKEGLMKVALYELNGRPAGFIAYTSYSNTFMRSAIMKHWLYVSYLLLLSILKDPRVLFRFAKSWRLMLSRRSESRAEDYPYAEILAFAVRPEYRTIGFIHDTKLRIPHELISHAANYFRGLGMTKMFAVVDSFNKPVQLFFHSLGGEFERVERKKETMFRIHFDLKEMPV